LLVRRRLRETSALAFSDSATGYSVQPQQVVIDGAIAQAPSEGLLVNPDGRATVYVSGGSNVSVVADGYKPLSVTVQPDNPTTTHFIFLTPLRPPGRLRSQFLRSLERSDAMLLVGYVVDDASGHPS